MPEDFGAPKGHRTFQPLLVPTKVRYVGDRVAFVVAETRRAGARCRRTGRGRVRATAGGGRPRGGGQGGRTEGLGRQRQGQRRRSVDVRQQGRDRRGLRQGQAPGQAARRATTGSSPNAMEPRVAIGDYDAADDQYTLYAASQNPHGVRMEMSHIFHCAGEPDPRRLAGRRRRLRAEGRPLSRTTCWCCGRRSNSAAR